jgi:hypothetical protein
MKTPQCTKALCTITLAMLLALPAAGTAANTDASQATPVIYLGKVKVVGQKQIVATLQAIKVGLEMPYSSDPKMANVVVCRLVDQAGSHIKQWLICGTNRILGQQREAIATAMEVAITAGSSTGSTCASAACYTRVFAVLNETLNSQPGNYLHTLVNGAALRGLLRKIPYPASLAPAATPAPAASTRQ